MTADGILIAIDWGTTNVRAALLRGDGMLLEERRGDSGVGRFSEREFGARFDELTREWPKVPVIAAGMVGSRQGWHEAPYIACPTGLSDLGAKLETFRYGRFDISIVPGLSCQHRGAENDVMRGEEAQILGLLARYPDHSGTLVLPGTHSKWVEILGGTIIRFQTYLTGDLFEALSRHSILSHSMENSDETWADEAFIAGFADIFDGRGSDLGRFFPLRADQLVLGADVAANRRERLSGLLIGMEFAAAQKDGFDTSSLAIIGTGELIRLYEIGARHLHLKCQLHRGTNLIWPALMELARQAGLLEMVNT